jgi:hypothetical protein
MVILPPSRRLVLHSESGPPQNPPARSVPCRSRDQISADYRAIGNDLSPSTSLRGIAASVIAQLGYKRHTMGQVGKMPIPRGAIVIPCRAPDGRITALHDEKGQWSSTPQPHCVNLARAQFSNEIHLFNFTIEADAWALQHNDACVALNGFAIERLSQYLTGPSPRIVEHLEARAA